MTAEDRTEADSVAELAAKAAEPALIPLEAGKFYRLVTQFGTEDIDTEGLLPRPHRKQGVVQLTDPGSLVTYVRRHTETPGETVSETTRAVHAGAVTAQVFADVHRAEIVAVLDGHERGKPGWGDHRALLTLERSPEWDRWLKADRAWLTQRDFAERIEEGLPDIADPAGAVMLEIAQSLQAHNKVDWKSQTILANGQRQFAYTETVEAKAGQTGRLEIPQRFKLGIRPFVGSEAYAVEARFQFRIPNGDLAIRYLLTRPDEVVRTAFDDVVGEIERQLGFRAFRGRPA